MKFKTRTLRLIRALKGPFNKRESYDEIRTLGFDWRGFMILSLFILPVVFLFGKYNFVEAKINPIQEVTSIKQQLLLEHCRTTQAEEEHVKKGNGSMYAMDIACIRGQTFDVYAPLWKNVYEVRKVGYDNRLGNHIILKHGEYWLVFAHVETLLKKGDRVYPGDEIGLVDKSGMSENYHLHFELWYNDYNISYKHMYGDEVVYNMEHTYNLRKQRDWYIGEVEAMDFIADWEGFRKCAYYDGINSDGSTRYSIGYGTSSYPGECISKQEAKNRKISEIARLMKSVYKNHQLKYHNQRQALVSALYNLGINSDISDVKHLKNENEILDWFGLFVKAEVCITEKNPEGICRGLVDRRGGEGLVYTGKTYLN